MLLKQNEKVSTSTKKRSWRRLVLRSITIYLGIGFSISFVENLWGTATGGLTAFGWTGSLKGNAILLFWWFVYPALTWPYDLYWTLYWKVFR
jgi:hypothetical protein